MTFALHSFPVMIAQLRSPTGPRILGIRELVALANPQDGRSERSVARAVDGLEAAGALERIRRGLYVNRLSHSPVADMELLHLLRAGAVVSLHSALGRLGVLSGAPRIVTGVVPLRPGDSPKLGQIMFGPRLETRLFGMPEHLLRSPELDELGAILEGDGFPCASPEKALADWIWLSERPRSSLGPPPIDADLDLVDLGVAGAMADIMGVRPALDAWLERKREHDSSEAVQQNGLPGAGI